MSDRPSNLDLGRSSQLATQAQLPQAQLPQAPSPLAQLPMARLHWDAQPEGGHAAPSQSAQEDQILQDAARLRELLGGTKDFPAPPMAETEPPTGQLLRPLDLFGGSFLKTQEPEPATIGSSTPVAELEENIVRMARTLMVSQGPEGVARVRMELGREHFPGVVLEVFRNEGTLVAQFVCASEQSRALLGRAVPWLGESLSRRLKSDTLIRVQTDDPEDPLPVEVRNRATPV